MDHRQARHAMTAQDLLAWRSSTKIASSDGEDFVGDMDEPPYHPLLPRDVAPDFHKALVRPLSDRSESLLTKALHHTPSAENVKPEIHLATEMSRRRSLISNTSTASTADLTSDGGITSPARTDTPSPPFPPATYITVAPYALDMKTEKPVAVVLKAETKQAPLPKVRTSTEPPKSDPAVEALVKKRCITFACGAQKPKPVVTSNPTAKSDTEVPKEAPKRCTIKFACLGPKAAKAVVDKFVPPPSPKAVNNASLKPAEPQCHHSRSPSMNRKTRPTSSPHTKPHRDSTSTVRRASQSPAAVRSRKPTYIKADEDALQSSEATRFHEFATDEVQEDDWIRTDALSNKAKLTINDTLKKENAIRQLGKEAEEEALEDEEDDEEEEEYDDAGDSDDENEEDEDQDIEFYDDDENTVEASDDGNISDGNETDNEAGFADSDDESDAGGDYQFWTPGRSIPSTEPGTVRAPAHRTASESSIDSLKHMSPVQRAFSDLSQRGGRSRRIKIRPGTPDLPDSTDFVCGTLDEDRPLEDAYVSCMEARKREKHHLIPQDIDPSFPTSEPEDEDEEDIVERGHDSDEQVWLHGKFEDSDEDRSRRRKPSLRKSPNVSPRRMHSPPPPKRYHSPPPTKTRHRSPPPRRLFSAHSPKPQLSPPPARTIRSPPASPTSNGVTNAISFAPLASRPGLTHTKSLPRRPNAFCQQYRAARLAAMQATEGSDNVDGHTRGAIDIYKGLEQKRQRRKEKFYQKYCNRARKVQPDRKPQPGKGAERMKEVGLYMAGKVEIRNGKAEFVLSV